MRTKIRLMVLVGAVVMTLLSAAVNTRPIAAEPMPTESQPAQYYLLRAHNGGLAIFSSQSTEPIRELDVNMEDLPPRDVTRLTEGIRAGSLAEAMQLAEDYE